MIVKHACSDLVDSIVAGKGKFTDLKFKDGHWICPRCNQTFSGGYKMLRKAHWGQESPARQLQVILGTLGCEIANIRDGIPSKDDKRNERMKSFIADAEEIAYALADGADPGEFNPKQVIVVKTACSQCHNDKPCQDINFGHGLVLPCCQDCVSKS